MKQNSLEIPFADGNMNMKSDNDEITRDNFNITGGSKAFDVR